MAISVAFHEPKQFRLSRRLPRRMQFNQCLPFRSIVPSLLKAHCLCMSSQYLTPRHGPTPQLTPSPLTSHHPHLQHSHQIYPPKLSSQQSIHSRTYQKNTIPSAPPLTPQISNLRSKLDLLSKQPQNRLTNNFTLRIIPRSI